MSEGTLPETRAEQSLEVKGPTPEQLRAAFEESYKPHIVGEMVRNNEDGTETTIQTYELVIDPVEQRERRSIIADFGVRAAQAKYKQALGPVVLPSIGFKDPEGTRSLTAVYFFLEKPVNK